MESGGAHMSDVSTYKIKFGSAFSVDGFGFVGKGTITTDPQDMELAGRSGIPVLRPALFAIGLALTLVSGLMWSPLMFIAYFCLQRKSLRLPKSKVTEFTRDGCRITFQAPPGPGQNVRQCLFKTLDEDSARAIELSMQHPASGTQHPSPPSPLHSSTPNSQL